MKKKRPVIQPKADMGAVMASMLALRKRRQETMAKNRSKIKNRTGAIKWPNDLVAKVRGQYISTAGMKNVGLMQVAALNCMPISTVRKLIYQPGYRAHTDAQIQQADLPKYKAQMMAIQEQYDSYAKQELKDIQSSKDAGNFSTADKIKLIETAATPAIEALPEWQQAIEGKVIRDQYDATDAARSYLQGSNNFNGRALSVLAREIMHGLSI